MIISKHKLFYANFLYRTRLFYITRNRHYHCFDHFLIEKCPFKTDCDFNRNILHIQKLILHERQFKKFKKRTKNNSIKNEKNFKTASTKNSFDRTNTGRQIFQRSLLESKSIISIQNQFTQNLSKKSISKTNVLTTTTTSSSATISVTNTSTNYLNKSDIRLNKNLKDSFSENSHSSKNSKPKTNFEQRKLDFNEVDEKTESTFEDIEHVMEKNPSFNKFYNRISHENIYSDLDSKSIHKLSLDYDDFNDLDQTKFSFLIQPSQNFDSLIPLKRNGQNIDPEIEVDSKSESFKSCFDCSQKDSKDSLVIRKSRLLSNHSWISSKNSIDTLVEKKLVKNSVSSLQSSGNDDDDMISKKISNDYQNENYNEKKSALSLKIKQNSLEKTKKDLIENESLINETIEESKSSIYSASKYDEKTTSLKSSIKLSPSGNDDLERIDPENDLLRKDSFSNHSNLKLSLNSIEKQHLDSIKSKSNHKFQGVSVKSKTGISNTGKKIKTKKIKNIKKNLAFKKKIEKPNHSKLNRKLFTTKLSEKKVRPIIKNSLKTFNKKKKSLTKLINSLRSQFKKTKNNENMEKKSTNNIDNKNSVFKETNLDRNLTTPNDSTGSKLDNVKMIKSDLNQNNQSKFDQNFVYRPKQIHNQNEDIDGKKNFIEDLEMRYEAMMREKRFFPKNFNHNYFDLNITRAFTFSYFELPSSQIEFNRKFLLIKQNYDLIKRLVRIGQAKKVNAAKKFKNFEHEIKFYENLFNKLSSNRNKQKPIKVNADIIGLVDLLINDILKHLTRFEDNFAYGQNCFKNNFQIEIKSF